MCVCVSVSHELSEDAHARTHAHTSSASFCKWLSGWDVMELLHGELIALHYSHSSPCLHLHPELICSV